MHGRLFDRFDIDARAALGPKGPSVHGELDFRRVEIEALAPELLAFGDGRGIASGRVTVDLEPGQPLALDVLLPELWLSVARAIDGPERRDHDAAGAGRGRRARSTSACAATASCSTRRTSRPTAAT